MAYKASLFLSFFLLVSTSLAIQQKHGQRQQQQQQRNVCQLRNIEALEPNYVIQAEAGVTEFWDSNDQQFQCAGVDFIRHRIQPGGLLLPSYANTPILALVETGRAVQGIILPGCPETYEYSQQQQQGQGQGQGQRQGQGQQGQSFQDRHQRVENLNPGDVAAVPTGAAHWLYNDGDNELVVVVFFDVQNSDNQLDQQNHRRFFLAGNPQDQSQQAGQGRREQQQQQQRPGRQQQPQQNAGNIFNGFDTEFIAEAFNVDHETAQKLQGQGDQRGHIVNVQQGQLQIIRPQQSQRGQQQPWGPQRGQQQQPWGPQRGQQQPWGPQRGQQGGPGSNGLEETICSLKLRENIDNPSHADFVNPQAGRISNLNNFKFPILQLLQLSVERGELYPNAIQAPHWTFNAHNLLYVTDGTLRVQIVDNQGNSVFNDELRQGQVVVIPQNFAVIKRAGQQGSRWISFRTNENAMISNLAGRASAIRSLPVGVVANSYQISTQEAQRLKYSQQETVLLSPGRSSGERIEKAAL